MRDRDDEREAVLVPIHESVVESFQDAIAMFFIAER